MSDSTTPLLPAVTAILTGGRKFGGANGIIIDRGVAAAASLGLCLAVLRMVSSAYRSAKRIGGDTDQSFDDSLDPKPTSGGAFYGFFRRWLRRMLLDEELDPKLQIGAAHRDDVLITHQGSCHCESVHFEMIAPRCLTADEVPGKIYYRHTEIKSNRFRIIRGKENLKTYYVSSRRSASTRGAHAFCERCGVHILYAPGRNSPNLRINVNCLSEDGISRIRLTKKKERAVTDGLTVREQWDDQLSTISEVTQDPQLFVYQSAESSISAGSSVFGAYTHPEEPPAPSFFGSSADKKSPMRATPATPSTVESFSAGGSQIPPISIPTLHGGSTSSVSELETSHPHNMTNSDFSVSSTPSLQASIPEMRNHMKKYMKKHISSSSTMTSSNSSIAEEKKSTQ